MIKKARKKISPKIRQAVYDKYDGHCGYCGIKFKSIKEMQIDHIAPVYIAELKGQKPDDSINNFMPACRACNFYKSTHQLEYFRDQIATLHSRLDKQFIYRLAKQYGMVKEHEMPLFYFEKCKCPS